MKDIKGFEGKYAITSCGRVWSYKNNMFLKSHPDKDGYLMTLLYDSNGKGKMCKIHRLVAEAYIPNPDNLPLVNHKDEIKHHSYLNNLEWCTKAYNNHYSDIYTRGWITRKQKQHL